ncbi:MAG: potassium channel family protein [Gaiellaceae bacterium]
MTEIRPRRAAGWLLNQPLTARRAGRAIAVATVAITLLSGVAMWLVDRAEFPNVWLGLWWAVQTVTTVGYGDITPENPFGRVIAAVVMVSGIGFLTVVTATIAAVFVESSRRHLRGESERTALERLDEIAGRLERIERALEERR